MRSKATMKATQVVICLLSHAASGIYGAKNPSAVPTQRPSESIYGDFGQAGLSSEAQQGILGAMTVGLFMCMLFEVKPPEILFLGAVVICLILNILTLEEGLSGFSNPSMIAIGALFFVVGGVEKSHVVDWIARKTFGSDGTVFMGKLRMLVTCFSLSIFFNNTPLVAILLPVVKDWGRMRNVAASQLLMPLSYSVLAGSFVTMIGTSTNLTVQGLMQADRGYSFGFFAPAPFGVILFCFLLAYQLIMGPILLPKEQVGLFRTARDKAETLMAEIYVSPDSPAVGKGVGEMMNSLGVAPCSAIKIRRKLKPTRPASVDDMKTASVKRQNSILDWNYMKRNASKWSLQKKPKPPGETPETSQDDLVQYAVSQDADGGDAYIDLVVPNFHELIAAHDIVFVSSAQDLVAKMMKSIAGESKGLYILNSNAMALPGFGTELLECVVSHQNPFLGKKVSEIAPLFAERYQAGIITVRGKDWDRPFSANRGSRSRGASEDIVDESGLSARSEVSQSSITQRKPFSMLLSGGRSHKHNSQQPHAVVTMNRPRQDYNSVVNQFEDHHLHHHEQDQDQDQDQDQEDMELGQCGIELEDMYDLRQPADIVVTLESKAVPGSAATSSSSPQPDEHTSPYGVSSLSADTDEQKQDELSPKTQHSEEVIAADGSMLGHALRDISPEAAVNIENLGAFDGSNGEKSDCAAAGIASTLDKSQIQAMTVSDHVLGYGDIVLCVSNQSAVPRMQNSKDFFVVSAVGSLPKPLDTYKLIPVFIFVIMLGLVAGEVIEMTPAALCVTVVYFFGGWITPDEIPHLIDLRLLMLIGCSLSYAQAVQKSGLANTVAKTISSGQSDPMGAMFIVYGLTLACTELVSNNASAALMYPISVAIADELGVSFKPFAMCVLIAATSGFMSPVGYQTHLMVWGPGGYRFRNFLIFGAAPDVIYWTGACLLIPLIFPF